MRKLVLMSLVVTSVAIGIVGCGPKEEPAPAAKAGEAPAAGATTERASTMGAPTKNPNFKGAPGPGGQ